MIGFKEYGRPKRKALFVSTSLSDCERWAQDNLLADEAAGTVFIHCLSCGMESKKYPTEFQAIRSWNKAALHVMKKRQS